MLRPGHGSRDRRTWVWNGEFDGEDFGQRPHVLTSEEGCLLDPLRLTKLLGGDVGVAMKKIVRVESEGYVVHGAGFMVDIV